MDNRQDLDNIREQLETIKRNNISSMEGIEAINLIMVDNNNARVKDAGLADQVARLGEKIREMSFELRKTEEMLKGRQFH
ncbi:MAG: hypothetical protein GXY97_05570 [Clostridiales bacterium]|jgi:RecA/RadA recombinase|nr:hypothetical protein [Clostridiales bacterium]HOC09407.1 hypothetical protein [Bacillota bacterium]HQA48233.1 hypothetical protein [Bacillota bacterium]HQD42391.1 hypothetical protein [Bacillota bacterium]